MEIEKKLNVPAPFFYNQLIDSVVYDIRKYTDKTVSRKHLANFSYVKEFSKNNRAKITIERAIENKAYQFKTSTVKNDFTVSYDIETIDETHCMITYREEMVSHGSMQKLNDMTIGFLLGFFKKRRFVKMLEMMEQSY